MEKLTETQIEILTSAANKDDHTIEPLPQKINAGIAPRVLQGLMTRELIKKTTHGHTITKKGFEAINLTPIKKITKKQRLIRLVSADNGASLAELCEATGWKNHSVRGTLSNLRKEGHQIISQKNDEGKKRYFIKKPLASLSERSVNGPTQTNTQELNHEHKKP